MEADGNKNGVVDLADYTIWRDNLGAALPSYTVSEHTDKREVQVVSFAASQFSDSTEYELAGLATGELAPGESAAILPYGALEGRLGRLNYGWIEPASTFAADNTAKMLQRDLALLAVVEKTQVTDHEKLAEDWPYDAVEQSRLEGARHLLADLLDHAFEVLAGNHPDSTGH